MSGLGCIFVHAKHRGMKKLIAKLILLMFILCVIGYVGLLLYSLWSESLLWVIPVMVVVALLLNWAIDNA